MKGAEGGKLIVGINRGRGRARPVPVRLAIAHAERRLVSKVEEIEKKKKTHCHKIKTAKG